MAENEAVVAAQEVLEVTPRMNRWAEASVIQTSKPVKLSLRQLSALTMIEDDETTLGDVAKQLMVTPAVVTGLIDRLEKRGYARRINSTDDRRRIYLALTPEGREAQNTAQQYLAGQLSERLSELSPSDLAAIRQAFTVLGPILDELEKSTPASSGVE